MAISRRALGLGLLAASAPATGGYVYLREHPEVAGRFGEPNGCSALPAARRRASWPTRGCASCWSAASA